VVLAADILERVRRDFAGEDLAAAEELLEAYQGPEISRISRCVLHLADGALSKLRYFLKLAQEDYRDVILFAEYDRNNQRIRNFTSGFEQT
jgi:hypothetical protein